LAKAVLVLTLDGLKDLKNCGLRPKRYWYLRQKGLGDPRFFSVTSMGKTGITWPDFFYQGKSFEVLGKGVARDGQYLDTCNGDTYRAILLYRYRFSMFFMSRRYKYLDTGLHTCIS